VDRPIVEQTISHIAFSRSSGKGAWAVAYKALDTHLDRPVALKLLPLGSVADPERKRRFVQETKAASASVTQYHPCLRHRLCRRRGVHRHGNVSGKTLGQLIERIGRKGLMLQEALKYSIQIADGLGAAQSAGIVHRDVKPPTSWSATKAR
jgi:serine/threonine protein kinase